MHSFSKAFIYYAYAHLFFFHNYLQVSAMVEGIVIDVSEIKELDLSPAVFQEASNLRLLKICNSSYSKKCKLYLPKNLQFLPDALRYLQWDEYPSKSLPSNFNSEKLVELIMPNSQVEQLWNGVVMVLTYIV